MRKTKKETLALLAKTNKSVFRAEIGSNVYNLFPKKSMNEIVQWVVESATYYAISDPKTTHRYLTKFSKKVLKKLKKLEKLQENGINYSSAWSDTDSTLSLASSTSSLVKPLDGKGVGLTRDDKFEETPANSAAALDDNDDISSKGSHEREEIITSLENKLQNIIDSFKVNQNTGRSSVGQKGDASERECYEKNICPKYTKVDGVKRGFPKDSVTRIEDIRDLYSDSPVQQPEWFHAYTVAPTMQYVRSHHGIVNKRTGSGSLNEWPNYVPLRDRELQSMITQNARDVSSVGNRDHNSLNFIKALQGSVSMQVNEQITAIKEKLQDSSWVENENVHIKLINDSKQALLHSQQNSEQLLKRLEENSNHVLNMARAQKQALVDKDFRRDISMRIEAGRVNTMELSTPPVSKGIFLTEGESMCKVSY